MQIESVRGRLMTELAQLENEILLSSRAGDPAEQEKAVEDLAGLDVQRQLGAALLTAKCRRKRKIEEALNRIEKGTFGICRDCGEGIADVRLKVDPSFTRCCKCEEAEEARRVPPRRRAGCYPGMIHIEI